MSTKKELAVDFPLHPYKLSTIVLHDIVVFKKIPDCFKTNPHVLNLKWLYNLRKCGKDFLL